jgi:sugar phosphate isomerase/epimerase
MLLGAAAAAGAMASAAQAAPAKKTAEKPASNLKPMPLVLSAIATEGGRTPTSIENLLTFDEFLALAKTIGYDGVHMRASLAGIQTPLNQLYEMSARLKAANMVVSSVSPDFPTPLNNDPAADCLRNITPYLTVAEIFGTDLIRVGMKKDEDIPWAQKAADEAKERKLKLVHHAEARTMFENFTLSMSTLKAINRENFGLQYDEAQWMCNTPNYNPKDTVSNIKAIGPWIWEVFIKNQPNGPGPMARPEIPIDAKNGVNFDNVFEGLDQIGYTGCVQVHQKTEAYNGDPKASPIACYKFLRPYTSRTKK